MFWKCAILEREHKYLKKVYISEKSHFWVLQRLHWLSDDIKKGKLWTRKRKLSLPLRIHKLKIHFSMCKKLKVGKYPGIFLKSRANSPYPIGGNDQPLSRYFVAFLKVCTKWHIQNSTQCRMIKGPPCYWAQWDNWIFLTKIMIAIFSLSNFSGLPPINSVASELLPPW